MVRLNLELVDRLVCYLALKMRYPFSSKKNQFYSTMHALRYQVSSTNRNVATLIGLLKDPACSEVRLFATYREAVEGFSNEKDGGENNLPLVAAVAKYEIPNIADVFVVFDGLFLTAQRFPRFREVQSLMDEAQDAGKASFCPVPVRFTSSVAPAEAAQVLWSHGNLVQFSAATRARYFSLLSSVSESEFV